MIADTKRNAIGALERRRRDHLLLVDDVWRAGGGGEAAFHEALGDVVGRLEFDEGGDSPVVADQLSEGCDSHGVRKRERPEGPSLSQATGEGARR
jgi:hypothetical protein